MGEQCHHEDAQKYKYCIRNKRNKYVHGVFQEGCAAQ